MCGTYWKYSATTDVVLPNHKDICGLHNGVSFPIIAKQMRVPVSCCRIPTVHIVLLNHRTCTA
ncbi:hypothetical protein PILCRDRAFT_736216 [Piloderma croceum F 1598]|uniref:Uncharacterized protein n=1 Tax=Piloderma croceum (strain F 1598) TaxID=765440 RepID=A0A0C3EYU0_PILCF|nr:hypothetical protein PILCRDRAFT_736216 [Piloderma croceum F 1598]